jgi:hypothetical protein
LYKEILKVPIVVEATMEEQVSRVDNVIKRFHRRVKDLHLHTILGTTPEEWTRRERTMMIAVKNVKKLDEECAKLC